MANKVNKVNNTDDSKTVINIRVEYDPTPIRHIAIQCPHCGKWFHGYDLIDKGEWLSYDYQIQTTTFTCPICDKIFGFDAINSLYSSWNKPQFEYNIQEVGSAEECYKDCVTKKEVWE